MLCLASLATGPWSAAQTEAQLDIQTCAGLTISGEIGKVYSVEYVTDLTDPAESDWRCLEYLQLPASSYLWADNSAPATGKRFSLVVSDPRLTDGMRVIQERDASITPKAGAIRNRRHPGPTG
jgi:hypothetical protein